MPTSHLELWMRGRQQFVRELPAELRSQPNGPRLAPSGIGMACLFLLAGGDVQLLETLDVGSECEARKACCAVPCRRR